MIKFIQAFLTGVFFTFIFDYFIFLGIKLNYIDFHGIDLYYNILFADNQNIYIYALISALVGFTYTYINNIKINIILIGFLSIMSLLTIIPVIGLSLGEMLFMKKNVTYKSNKYTYVGDVYYDGRKNITFYDYELQKTILLNKKDLIK
jgi:hypothetical protein